MPLSNVWVLFFWKCVRVPYDAVLIMVYPISVLSACPINNEQMHFKHEIKFITFNLFHFARGSTHKSYSHVARFDRSFFRRCRSHLRGGVNRRSQVLFGDVKIVFFCFQLTLIWWLSVVLIDDHIISHGSSLKHIYIYNTIVFAIATENSSWCIGAMRIQ